MPGRLALRISILSVELIFCRIARLAIESRNDFPEGLLFAEFSSDDRVPSLSKSEIMYYLLFPRYYKIMKV